MASDGINKKAKHGTCRMCQRRRNTDNQVKPVGEVRHGFALGHIWECIDIEDCDKVIKEKLLNINTRAKILIAVERGRFSNYTIIV